MAQSTIIVGGGVIGCAIALRLVQKGVDVTLIERQAIGAEASSAAAGLLAPQVEMPAPGPLLELGLRSRTLYPAFVEEVQSLSDIDVRYLRTGMLHVAFGESEAAAAAKTLAWQKDFGLAVELLDGAQARELEPHLSEDTVAALLLPHEHQVDSQRLMRALAESLRRLAVKHHRGKVQRIVTASDRAVGVEVDGQIWNADSIVVAAGAWSSLLPNGGCEPEKIKPVRGQMIQLRPPAPLFQRTLHSARGYLVPRADGSIVAGSTVEHVGFEQQVTAGGLAQILAMALEMCPDLQSASVQEVWCGLRPWAEGSMPLIGAGPLPGLFLATGHFRNGILLAPATAEIVVQAITEGSGVNGG